jgi:hypothetical protein
VSSLGSEALQIKINTNVTATIGDTNVELWCSYIKDVGDYISNIKMYNNTSKTSITCNMSELHQRNLCLCLLLFGGRKRGAVIKQVRNTFK